MPSQNSEERNNRWLPRDLSIYNLPRRHYVLSGRSQQQRL